MPAARTPPARRFRRALEAQGPAISVELALKRDSGAGSVAAQAELFMDRVDAVQVLDNPLAWVHMSPVAAAALLLEAGLDPVPTLTCRDRNRIALMSDLLGLRALGVESLVLWRGRRVGPNHALHPSTVFDMTGRELIAMAAGLSEEIPGPRFLIGAGARVQRVRPNWTGESLSARCAAGAGFLQTQLCFDVDLLRHWLEALVGLRLTWRSSVVVSLAVLPSAKTARWVSEQMSDSAIPEHIIGRLESAADPLAEGVAICAETMRAVAALPGVSGIHLVSTGDPGAVAAAIDRSGLRQPGQG